MQYTDANRAVTTWGGAGPLEGLRGPLNARLDTGRTRTDATRDPAPDVAPAVLLVEPVQHTDANRAVTTWGGVARAVRLRV